MVTLVSGPDKLWASGTLLGPEEATRPHFLAGGDLISQQLGGSDHASYLYDLVVLVSAVELNLPGHDRTHWCAARHAVDGSRKIQLRLDLP